MFAITYKIIKLHQSIPFMYKVHHILSMGTREVVSEANMRISKGRIIGTVKGSDCIKNWKKNTW